jgi:mannosidase alpha-like ER degradation enhancer 2
MHRVLLTLALTAVVCAFPLLRADATHTAGHDALVRQAAAVAPPAASPAVTASAEVMAARVKADALHAWRAYRRHAWGRDMLRPISRRGDDWYGVPLNITPIDALDTLLIMGEQAEADAARRLIVDTTSFDRDVFVKNFEITIRLLGGLLSGYEMTKDPKLLALCDDLGRRLLPAFESPTGMPYTFVNLRTGKVREPNTNPAEIGTLLLEFGTLSRLTGKPVYFDKAKRAVMELYRRRSPIGLVGEGINVETGEWTSRDSHISGAIDSYYEYLLKSAILFKDADLRRMYDESMPAVHRYLADEVNGELWYGHADMVTGARTASHYGALDAFLPGMLVLGNDVARAARLQASSHRMWTHFGIEPERFDYRTMAVVEAGYPLRPEIAESAYYLWNATHDQRYRDMGAVYLEALDRYCRTEDGYTALSDVVTKARKDEMDSFFLAETLKYLYLLYAPSDTLDPGTVVFTTEAHPIRR